MGKEELIQAIRTHNRSASSQFLVNFDEPALHSYLQHLKYTSQPRGGSHIWVRAGETHSVVTRSH
jgi:hypothetical protein